VGTGGFLKEGAGSFVNSKKWTVLIIGDQTLVREGLRSILSAEDDFQVLGEEKDPLDAIRKVQGIDPDLILLDLSLERMEVLTALKGLRAHCPRAKILLLTVHKDVEYVLEAFKSGANGYCLKETSSSELLLAARNLLAGIPFIDPGVLEKLLTKSLQMHESASTRSVLNVLSPREQEVLRLIGQRYKTREIADLLFISKRTVEKHRSNIMKKLSLHRTPALVAFAIEHRLVGAGGGQEGLEAREKEEAREGQ
jgi:DNA-binding NarL/FixJ family response regulator